MKRKTNGKCAGWWIDGGPMVDVLREFGLAFVPMFVAVDAIGILPIFLSLTENMEHATRKRTVWQSVLTAMAVAVVFVFVGRGLFRMLGITMYDFMVAGGVLLFIIATLDLISGVKIARRIEAISVVPLGIPLIAGPAVLTTGLMLVGVHGYGITLAAIAVNIIIAGAVLLSADFWRRILGSDGSHAVSKVASLLLAAIAVMLLRKGIYGIFPGLSG
ncbi:MAG: MarC family protein [Sedimentisphaerales bacterium]|nr:MarC family protein [Sedimentisphaerales bacterium]